MQRYNGTVAAWYSVHSEFTDYEWQEIEMFKGRFHPLYGYYKNDNPEIIKKQLHDMRRAGIDLIVLDIFTKMYPGKTLQQYLSELKSLKILLKELSNQQNEARKLKLCIYIEGGGGKDFGGPDPSLEEYEYLLNYIKKNMAEEDYYFKYNDRPLVLLYLNGFTPSVDEIEHKNTCFELRRVRPGHTDVWSYIEPYPQSLRKGWMPVSPGWDSYMETSWWYEKKNPNPDYEKVKRESSKADRENGEYYKRQLKRAMDAKTDILFISSWNDWQYMNQIEPAKEYGCQYVDLTAEVLGRKEETGYYRR